MLNDSVRKESIEDKYGRFDGTMDLIRFTTGATVTVLWL